VQYLPNVQRLVRLARAASLQLLGLAFASSSFAVTYGVNLHLGGGNATDNQTIANTMSARNVKMARLDFHNTSEVTNLRDQIGRLNAAGGSAQLVIENYWDAAGTCPQNFTQVESDSYNNTYPMVQAMKDMVHDYEILNEIQNMPQIAAQVTKNSQLSSTAGYYASPCSMTIAAVARGISRAIHDNGQRAILGIVGRDWGFLTFMSQQNVAWDVTGAHFYQQYVNASLDSDSWWGTNGPLYQLHQFGKPVTVNEFNCGETYITPYDYETCLKSINKQLTELKNDPYGTIDSILYYELLDEPTKTGAEAIFGLEYGLTSPKIGLYLASAWSCGQLSSTERQQLTSRGLVDGTQCASSTTTTTSTSPPPSTTSTDTTPPSVSITNPANGASFPRHSVVPVNARATDNVGVATITFSLNGNTICAGTASSCTMRLPKQVRSNTIAVVARDAAGNVGQASITVYTH
jgi:hypothetical protein